MSDQHAITIADLVSVRDWSSETFGPSEHRGPSGPIDHLREELQEVTVTPDDPSEWADIIILAFDGAWRAGIEPADMLAAIHAKWRANRARTWPDWRGRNPDKRIKHVEARPVVYIAGPMAGYADLNEPAFRVAASEWEDRGYRAIVPHDINVREHLGDCPPVYGYAAGDEGDHDGGCYLRADVADLLAHADVAYFLPGWQESKGASIEHEVCTLFQVDRRYARGADS